MDELGAAAYYPTPEDQKNAISGLQPLIKEALRDLKSRVDFLHVCLQPDSAERKAQYKWCVALGVLAHEIATSASFLIDAEHLRAAKILARSLHEYHLRLRIYQLDPSEALHDAAEAPKELRRFFESKPADDVLKLNLLTAEEFESFKLFIDSNQGRPQRRNVAADVKRLSGGNDADSQFEYLNLYGFPNALVHGSGLVFSDIFITQQGTATTLA